MACSRDDERSWASWRQPEKNKVYVELGKPRPMKEDSRKPPKRATKKSITKKAP